MVMFLFIAIIMTVVICGDLFKMELCTVFFYEAAIIV